MLKPYPPPLPYPVITTKRVVLEEYHGVGNYENIQVRHMPEGTETVEIDHEVQDLEGEPSLNITYVKYVALNDAQQRTENRKYTKRLHAYETQLLEYQRQQEEYDKYITHENTVKQRQQYEELKKLYEKGDNV